MVLVKKIKQSQEAATYSKEQLLLAKKYKHKKDVLNVVLEENQNYTIEEVDDLIDKFNKVKG